MPSLKLPKIVQVLDYHEFESILDVLKQLGASGVRYRELLGYPYRAVFYTGRYRGSEAQHLAKENNSMEGDDE